MTNAGELLRLPDVAQGLNRVDEALRRSVTGDDPFLTEVAGHLIHAGGKRLRPALTVSSSLAGGAEPSDDVVMGAVATELVHLGSLYHDDVMDEAATRRGVPSVNGKWGNLVAIVAGDFLLARASGIAADLGTEVSALLAATIGRLCEGQVAEVQTAFSTERSRDAYLASISGKTASLFSAACRIGGITAPLPRPLIDALTGFGHALGMAFQVQDDVLDLVGSEERLGKPAGHDLVEGVYTLPVILALQSPRVGPELADLLGGPVDDPIRDKAIDLVRDSGAVGESVTVARRYADEAAAALAVLPDGPHRAGLASLGHELLDDLPV